MHVQGREVLAVAPTGSGKTLAYTLPILHSLKACFTGATGAMTSAFANVLPCLMCGADYPPRRQAKRRVCVR